jgi:hypothetical protein
VVFEITLELSAASGNRNTVAIVDAVIMAFTDAVWL